MIFEILYFVVGLVGLVASVRSCRTKILDKRKLKESWLIRDLEIDLKNAENDADREYKSLCYQEKYDWDKELWSNLTQKQFDNLSVEDEQEYQNWLERKDARERKHVGIIRGSYQQLMAPGLREMQQAELSAWQRQNDMMQQMSGSFGQQQGQQSGDPFTALFGQLMGKKGI